MPEKITISKLREAFKTINLEERGSDEDYARATTKEWEELKGFRERAEKHENNMRLR